MNENNIAEMEIEKFNENIKSFIETSKAYSKKNVQIKGIEQDEKMKNCLNEICGYQKGTSYLQVEVSMEIPKEILMSLYDIIQDFVQICETHDHIKPLSKAERDFISGVKFVNNVIKHKKKDFSITDLIIPDYKVEADTQSANLHKNGVMGIPLEEVEFRLGAKWAPVKSEISNKMRNEGQLVKYGKVLRDYDVIDTIIEAKKIIDDHIIK